MNNNQSFTLLFNHFNSVCAKSLWVLDENPPHDCPPANQYIEVLSNRIDVVQHMQSLGYQASFSDFCFSQLEQNSYQYVFYRISKEKPLTHYVINSAQQLLAEEGYLIISGAKQEGIKGYLDRCAKRYSQQQLYKADKQHWAASYQALNEPSAALDDKDYPQLRSIGHPSNEEHAVEFFSKPGVFGWNKFDRGSLLLITHLQKLQSTLAPVNQALDIGCGYGLLSVMCGKLFNCSVTATDNNAAAISACRFNLKQHNIEHQVIATNCTQGIKDQFDLVVCNPPFHTGFGVENDLTNQFLLGAKRCLADSGCAIFVVNLHIPLERKAQQYFKQVTTLSDDKHFKVILLQ